MIKFFCALIWISCFLCSDEHLLVLGRDNETIVDEAAIGRDHDLMKRTHCYGILSDENQLVSQGAAALFTQSGPRYGAGKRTPIGLDTTMDCVLRPGEIVFIIGGGKIKSELSPGFL